MILYLEGQTATCSFYQNYLEDKTKKLGSNLEIDCAYYKEGQTIYTCFGEDKHTIINNEWF